MTYRLIYLACALYAVLSIALAFDAVMFLRPMLAA